MTHVEKWKAISSRIRGLIEAAKFYEQIVGSKNDTFGVRSDLNRDCRSIHDLLARFLADFNDSLPGAASDAIGRFLGRVGPLIESKGRAPALDQAATSATLALLAAFECEVSFLLSDAQEFVRLRSERAFVHLQRSIVVDSDLRAKWGRAFEGGEVECEKLGAIHLLLHGIWAFKADAAGARTDLVLQQPVTDVTAIQGYAEGLVLTEWKRATRREEAAQRFEEARVQAKRYATGALAITELAAHRYAVLVSRDWVDVPRDVLDESVTYRHINIAVEPATPSKEGRMRARK